MAKRKLQSEFEKVKNEPEECLHKDKKIKLDDDRYFIMTSSEDGITYIYEMNKSHKMFKIVIDAFLTREFKQQFGREGYNYEISLFALLAYKHYHEKEEDGGYKLENDERRAICDFLGLEKLKQYDFKGFIIDHNPWLTLDDIEFKRYLMKNGRVLYLKSWC